MEVETLRTAVSGGRGSSFVAVTSQVPATLAVSTALLLYPPVVRGLGKFVLRACLGA